MSLMAFPKNNIVIRLREEGKEILRERYLYYVFGHLFNSKVFCHLMVGTAQQFLRAEDIKNIPMGDTNKQLKHFADVITNIDKEKVQKGDIILQRVGTCETIGSPYFKSNDIEKF